MHREVGKLKTFRISEIDKLVSELRNLVSSYGKVLIACVGTELRRDDRAALELCRELESEGVEEAVQCPHGLENCLHVIEEARPRLLIVADAALLSANHDYVLADPSEVLDSLPLSTHSMPLDLVIEVTKMLSGVERVIVLGIRVEDVGIGLEMSKGARERVEALARALLGVFHDTKLFNRYFPKDST